MVYRGVINEFMADGQKGREDIEIFVIHLVENIKESPDEEVYSKGFYVMTELLCAASHSAESETRKFLLSMATRLDEVLPESEKSKATRKEN